jgi:hypothetical protein
LESLPSPLTSMALKTLSICSFSYLDNNWEAMKA